MKIRTRALIDIVIAVGGTLIMILCLNYFFPKYGLIIYMIGLVSYLVYCLYNLRVGMLEREQNKIVDTLKQ